MKVSTFIQKLGTCNFTSDPGTTIAVSPIISWRKLKQAGFQEHHLILYCLTKLIIQQN